MVQISKPAIPAKMYKQFAIITIATTACLALFTNAEPAAEGDGAADSATTASSSPQASSTPRYGQARLKTGSTVEVSDGFDSYESSDPPRPSGGGGGGNASAITAIGATEMPVAGTENAGFSREYLESLSDEELDELLRQLRAGGVEDPGTRTQIITLLNAASRRRGGRATSEQVVGE